MKKALLILLFIAPVHVGAKIDVTVVPATLIQGEPVMLVVSGAKSTSTLELSLRGKIIPLFMYKNAPTALVPLDLRQATGTYTFVLSTPEGTIRKDVVVEGRPKVEAPLGIPAKLGGNTPQAATTLVNTLAAENAILAAARTGTKAFWKEPFRFPLATSTVTDSYGYSRSTVGHSIAHKGTDFRAKEGTPLYAMNRGVVRLARSFRNYGNTIVVDHGLGLMTMYMHLSKISVNEGELVLKGQRIGKTGSTGYAESPHLHLSVRIDGVSIDPMKFMEFFK